ncbi:MAG: TonB-dependent receptor [Opitutus sp.]|nr:TonB-dependent receptor [Opitutus sp.]
MNHPKRFGASLRHCFAAAGALLAACLVSAQAPATGTIEGRVVNATNGQYLSNARVTVEGTDVETLTDSFGQYRLVGVRAGSARVKVAYSGHPSVEAAVNVTAGAAAVRDFTLGGGDRTGQATDVTKLDPFLVNSNRDLNNTAIAINDQRTAANVKTVIAAELVGELATDNVAEIMKYLPGVTLDGVSEASGVQVRGFAATFTTIMSNGALISSAAPDPSRYTSAADLSANSISRIEVTKVPTPEMPASSLGGTVNFVGKSAFESARPVFKYRLNVSAHSDEPNIFKKTAGPRDEQSYKGLPSLEMSYILPLSKNFGIALNAVTSNQYSGLKHELSPTWRFISPAATPAVPNVATPANPYYQQMSYGPQSRTIWRKAFGVQADWRPAKDHVLSASVQLNLAENLQDALLQVPTVGSSEAPTVVTGVPLTFGPTFTYGATGRGADNQQKYTYDQANTQQMVNLTHRYNGRVWEIDSGLSGSLSKTWWRDLSRGHFYNVRTSLVGVNRVLFDAVSPTGSLAQKITTLDAAGNAIDWSKLANYRVGSVETAPRDGRNTLLQARLNAKRTLDFLPFEASMKVGGSVSQDNRDMLRQLKSYVFVGADGLPNTTDDTAGPFVDAKSYVDKWRFVQGQEFASSYKLGALFKSNPGYFTQSAAQLVADEVYRMTRSFDLSERISAAYVQGDARVLHNRLRIVTGVRFERTDDEGRGPLFDPNGVFQRDAAGRLLRVNNAFVRKPEAGAAGSMQELPFIRKERGGRSEKSYDGYYPSLHLTYTAAENFLLRLAYAETFGRPDLSSILPNTTFGNESLLPAPGAAPGIISVANAGLKPYSAKSYDFSAEYYFPKGGVASVGAFRKDLKDFFGTLNTIATPALLDQFGIEQTYVGWELRSTINVGSAKVTGFEANYSQPLGFLPYGGRYFNVFANYTKIQLEGSNETDFTGFIPESASLGVNYSRKPVVATIRWNYRGADRRGLAGSALPGGFNYIKPFPSIDLSFEYQVSKRVSLFGSSRNVFGAPRLYERFTSETPTYSRIYRNSPVGVQNAIGVKGTF